MMRSISFIYSLILGFHLIWVNASQSTTSYTIGETGSNTSAAENITFMETTLSVEIKQTSSTEMIQLFNETYVIANFTFPIMTTEFSSFTTATTEMTSTSQVSSPTLTFDTPTTNSSIFLISSSSITIGMSTSTTATITLSTSPLKCNASTHVLLSNQICVLKTAAQISAVDALRNKPNNHTAIASFLSLYVAATTNANISWDRSYVLSPSEIDEYVTSLNDDSLTLNSDTSFIVVQPPNQRANITIQGALYQHDVGGGIVDTSNESNVYNSNLTAAAIIDTGSLVDVTSLTMFIIDQPTTYEQIDTSTNQNLASSVIVVSVQRNSSSPAPINISLYFQVLDAYRPSVAALYSCSFYDLNRSQWNESGCTRPLYNILFNRYECNCDHLSTFALVSSPNITFCNEDIEVKWINGTCISKEDAQKLSSEILSNTNDSTLIANLLSIYISSITNSNASLNPTHTLSLVDIDNFLDKINNVNLTIGKNNSFLIAQPINQDSDVIVLGASFTRGIGGNLINSDNKDNITSSPVSTAAIIGVESLANVTSLKMLIIRKPSAFRNIDNSSNKTLASSIIVTSVKRNNVRSTSMNISLYFQVLDEWRPNTTDPIYFCSFYDTLSLQWNESGCTKPQLNAQMDRYECSCNHLTSFALLWLPNIPLTRDLDAQDIASLVFESISIACFVTIIIHVIVTRFRDPSMRLRAYDLLPLISSASTTILFIFHIALGMTVYTLTSSTEKTQCFLSSSVLMFFVYFFLIFMFCAKTSVGYFNYLRFVCLFPQPSHRKLFIMLIASFFISIACVSFAAGFNSNSSFHITQLYPYKLCWFTRDVIYYFLTIPICLFLAINIILFILVAARIISHVRHATSPHQSFDRMKRCVIILLSSCLSQGIGWLFGPFLTFANPAAGEVLGWFFVVFNGLEGLWAIILYLIIRSQHMDKQKYVLAAKKFRKSKETTFSKYKKSLSNDDDNENEIKYRSARTKSSQLFDD